MLIRRYIAAHLIKAFLAALAVLTSVMVIVEWIQMGKFLSIRDFDLVLLAMVPMGLYVIPMSLLFSVLSVLERLSSESEIIAMQACAVPKRTIFIPVLLFALGCMLINLGIGTSWGPLSMQHIQNRLIEEAPKRLYSFLQERSFDDTFKGITIYVESVNPAKRRIQNIFIENKSKDHAIVTAGRGTIEMVDNRIIMRLTDGSLFLQTGNNARYVTFREYVFSLDVNLGKQIGIRNWEMATTPELKRMIAKEPDRVKWIKEYYNRYSFPFLNLILGLVGIAFGIQRPRAPKYTGFIIGIGTIFGYYLVFTLADRLVRAGHVPPLYGAWLPDVIFCAMLIGLWVWRRLRPMEG